MTIQDLVGEIIPCEGNNQAVVMFQHKEKTHPFLLMKIIEL
jgi:hypothetical protein